MEKTVFITGASADVAMETIKALSAENADVDYKIIGHFNRDDAKLKQTVENLPNVSLTTLQADLSNLSEVETLTDAVMAQGPVDYFLHFPALPFAYMRYKDLDIQTIQRELDVSLLSFLTITKKLFPAMKKVADARCVVMLTAFVTEELPPKFMVDYMVTKYGLLGAMKAAASEFGGSGFCINGISPQMMETKFLAGIDPRIIEMNAAKSPDGKLLSAKKVAGEICKMLSASYKENGSNVVVV